MKAGRFNLRWSWPLLCLLLAAARPAVAQAAEPGDQAPAVEEEPGGQAPAAEDETVWSASVEANPVEVKLGEPVILTIKIKAQGPAGQRPEYGLPARLDLDPFVELDREEQAGGLGGDEVAVFRLKIASFEKLGALEVPAFELQPRADGSGAAPIALPAVGIRVLSLLEGVADPSPRDLAGPVQVRVSDYRLAVVAGLLVLWGLLVLLLRRVNPAPEVPQRLMQLPPPRRAHEIAIEKLERIVADNLLRQGLFHAYFTRISETVREYMGNRYSFYALDLTSRELLEQLRDRLTPGLDAEQLGRLLAEADLVKFARHQPTDAACSRAIDEAHGVIESTRLRELSPEEQEREAG